MRTRDRIRAAYASGRPATLGELVRALGVVATCALLGPAMSVTYWLALRDLNRRRR